MMPRSSADLARFGFLYGAVVLGNALGFGFQHQCIGLLRWLAIFYNG